MIWLFSPFLPKEAGEEVKRTIESGFINRGKKAEEFERKLREKFNFFQVHSVNSCTSALKLSLKIAGVKEGDEVISTPWSMIATNTSILECGARPVFVDIKYETLNMNPDLIEEKITEKTKAIMVVHYAGAPADLKEIYKIAHKNHLEVIQDAAQALGAKYRGRYIGSFGRFCCFSFQAIKVITMGDGGCISTTSQEVYDEVVKRSWFGIDKRKRINSPLGSFPKDIETLGYKNNITDIDATLGLVGLRHLDEALKRRKEIFMDYKMELGNLRNLKFLEYRANDEPSYWLFPIHVTDQKSFAKFMAKNEIQVSKHNERNDRYKIFGGLNEDLEITKKVDEDIIHLPIYPSLTFKEENFIIRKVKEWNSKC